MSMEPPSARYPIGTDLTQVINTETSLREQLASDTDERLKLVEEQLFIIRYEQELGKMYPELKKAYIKYKYELEKVRVFEVLKR